MTPVVLLPVQGTEGWQVDDVDPARPRNWWRPGSRLMTLLQEHGLPLIDADDPFVWSTDLDGLWFWQRWRVRWLRARRDRDWLAGGKTARWYALRYGCLSLSPRLSADERAQMLARPRPRLIVVTHSHGLQVALHAAAEGLYIDRLLDIAGPVREDVLAETAAGLVNIGHWLHVTASDGDLVQILGRIGDGHLGGAVTLPTQVQVVALPGIDHSQLVSNPRFVPDAWRQYGLIDFLIGADAGAPVAGG